jgi:hypothetical protein
MTDTPLPKGMKNVTVTKQEHHSNYPMVLAEFLPALFIVAQKDDMPEGTLLAWTGTQWKVASTWNERGMYIDTPEHEDTLIGCLTRYLDTRGWNYETGASHRKAKYESRFARVNNLTYWGANKGELLLRTTCHEFLAEIRRNQQAVQVQDVARKAVDDQEAVYTEFLKKNGIRP